MATYQTYNDGRNIASASGANAAGAPGRDILVGEFNAGKRALSTSDVVEVINIPANTYVEQVFVKVLAADAGASINVGDGADPDGWGVGVSVAATDVLHDADAAFNASAKFYTADDTIDITATGTLDTARVRVYAVCSLLG